MRARDFITSSERDALEAAIRRAEALTSGEIRIHIDNRCGKDDPREQALRTFDRIGMDRTALRNGVLIYVAASSRVFAVIGDRGINEKVGSGFWDGICASIGEHFAAGRYAEGLDKAVELIGEGLSTHFPHMADDVNELPDEISFADDDKA